MTISSTGVNVHNDLAVSGNVTVTGNVGIGTVPNASYKVDVLGNIRDIGTRIIHGYSSIRDTLITSLYETRFTTTPNICMMSMRHITDADATPSLFTLGGDVNQISYDGYNNKTLYFRIFNLLATNSTTTRNWVLFNTGASYYLIML